MFRTFKRIFLPNPLDQMLKRLAKKRGKRILICWNRGLGDIALGLYAMVQQIKEFIPEAEITFLTRENLKEGFTLLEGVKIITDPNWQRSALYSVDEAFKQQFDLVIEKPDPTEWVSWQIGKVVPRLKWDQIHDPLHEKFGLSEVEAYIGVQVSAETHYGLWRNWPLARWQELFDRLEKMKVKVVLFGYGSEPEFKNANLIDLRGQTTLFELLALIKNRLSALVLPDSGISSMTYYLDTPFSLRLVTLWADSNQGILKQNVASPNPDLIHIPLIAKTRDLSTVTVDQVIEQLFPKKGMGAILLAGGQGTRLGFKGPKGLFPFEGKTLFEWFCKKMPKDKPLAIMTSPLNHDETVAYFKKNHFFGLDISFFSQETSPILNEQKQEIGRGPNGNGGVFSAFAKANLVEKFLEKKIDFVTVNYVDNLLNDPFDSQLVNRMELEQVEVLIQCIERASSDHSMGVLVQKDEKTEVVEYTELDPNQDYKYAYSGQITFDFRFFCKMAGTQLPLHWVQKIIDDQKVWKAEQFIFDVLPYAKQVSSFCVQRDTHFAPIKGPESIEKVQNLMRQT